MVSIFAFVHIVLSIFLVVLVLIQDPKGGGAGGMFGGGGGSNSLFGASGAPSFLAKVTRYVAIIFAASCISMTIFIKPSSESVLDKMDVSTSETTEAAGQDAATPPAETAPAPTEDQAPENK